MAEGCRGLGLTVVCVFLFFLVVSPGPAREANVSGRFCVSRSLSSQRPGCPARNPLRDPTKQEKGKGRWGKSWDEADGAYNRDDDGGERRIWMFKGKKKKRRREKKAELVLKIYK